MSYVKIANNEVEKYPYSIKELRLDNPNTSFPKEISIEMMNLHGMYLVIEDADPSYNSQTQKINKETVPTKIGNDWVLQKVVVDLTDDEISNNNADLAASKRKMRNNLLAASDWTQVNDSPLANETKTAWATYRQALRDITTHANWPNLNDDDWPTKP